MGQGPDDRKSDDHRPSRNMNVGKSLTRYIGAINQGTTSTRFIVFDRSDIVVSEAHKEHQQIYPQAGWVEHDPEEISRRSCEVITEALAKKNLWERDLAGGGWRERC
jgi:glycerol kinase